MKRMACPSCQLARINGMVCHETGCPDAWRSEVRECKECGAEFAPQERRDQHCSEQCWAIYNGLDWDDDSIDLSDE